MANANTIYVTTTAQKISDNGGCSLQEAISSANFDDNIAIASTNPDAFVRTECAPGNGDDTIILPAGGIFLMSEVVNDAHNPLGPAATPFVFTNIVIEANGSRLQRVTSAPTFRAFAVGAASISIPTAFGGGTASGMGNLTITNAYIRGFVVQGGHGRDGGGGGMGAGGAIYVWGGGLTIDNSTFELNGAQGGNGAPGGSGLGGGGGGLSGNGGAAAGGAGGGGGGGARGNGGNGQIGHGPGGGGGGTVLSGGISSVSAGGFRCGGGGGSGGGAFPDDGNGGACAGGGGGGGHARAENDWEAVTTGNGGGGAYGGGGGGAGAPFGDAGSGGFGGGGGGAGEDAGNGGFGGGGGGGGTGSTDDPSAGRGGTFGGHGSLHDYPGIEANGGGGAGLGGAIFSHGGAVVVRNSTFTRNYVVRGNEGGLGASRGQDAGGAIFAVAGSLTVLNATISGNESTGEGAGLAIYRPTTGEETLLTLRNTIIANNVPANRSCFFRNSVVADGSGNLIMNNFGCPGEVETSNPQLGPLQLNAPGNTPTMAIEPGTPAVNAADGATSLATDQRGVARPVGGGYDIGAVEARDPQADLRILKTVSASAAVPGDTIVYTLVVSNQGPDPASGIRVSDQLPSSVTLVSCMTSRGTCGGSGNTVTVDYATLASSASDTIQLTVTVDYDDADGTVVTNTATVLATSPADPSTADNTSSAAFTVQNKADLLLTQKVKKLSNRQLAYTVSVRNIGPYEARQLVLNVPMPNGTNFLQVTGGPWTCVPLPPGSVGTLTCTLSSLAPSAATSATLVFDVKTTAAGSVDIISTATVGAATFDPNGANNSATLVTRVSGK